MEGAPGDDRSEAACLHRRDLGEDQHDPHPWPMRQRRTPCRQSAVRADGGTNDDVSGGVAVDGLAAPCVIDGPINGSSFRAYVEQVLVPIFAPGDIVVMDNLRSHKGHCHSRRHPGRQSQGLLPAGLLARPQSDRAGVRQNENPAAQARRPNHRTDLANHRRPARSASPRPNAQTTSPTQAMLLSDQYRALASRCRAGPRRRRKSDRRSQDRK